MPQFTSPLSINDGSATPVAVSFAPEQLSSTQTVLVDRREAARDFQPSIEQTFDRASAQRTTFKVGTNVLVPVVREVGGITAPRRPIRIKIIADIPQEASAQERKHAYAFAVNALGNSSIKAGYVDLDPLY